jgi:hypothetical protein
VAQHYLGQRMVFPDCRDACLCKEGRGRVDGCDLLRDRVRPGGIASHDPRREKVKFQEVTQRLRVGRIELQCLDRSINCSKTPACCAIITP